MNTRILGLKLAKHTLMLGHCLRRLPNFNPSMGLNASCFLVRKKTLPTFTSHISPAYITRQLHVVTRFGTGIASGGPVLQTLGQH